MFLRSGHLAMCAALAISALTACDRGREKEGNSEKAATAANKKRFNNRAEEREAEFVVDAVSASYAGLRMAQLATEKSASDEVVKVAEMVAATHEKVILALKGLANERGISIPLESTGAAKRKIDDLSLADAKSFDKKWCTELMSRHEKLIENFEDTWEMTENPQLKTWISSELPDLRTDLVKLNACHEKLNM